MKRIIIKLSLLSLVLLTFMEAQSQHVTIEAGLKVQNYSETIAPEAATSLQLGYRFNDKWSLGLEYGYSLARHDVRMPNVVVSSTNWGGVIFNVLTVSNTASWTKNETKEVYKGYNREMYSYNAKLSFYPSPSWRLYAGPAMRYNKLMTESSEEFTHSGSLFSDLEFEDYINFGIVAGIDYIYDMSSWSYFKLGVDVQSDMVSNSNKISGSRFMGSSFSYGLGMGFKIGQTKKRMKLNIIE